jgi:transposase
MLDTPFMLWELSVTEQRYRAVLEVLAGVPVTEVAGRYGVSRQSVHAWLARYRDEGPPGLEDRSHKVHAHPWQIPAELESAVCELRRAHRKWGPKRLVFEMGRRGLGTVTRSTVYRVLIRNQLIEPRSRRRRRQDYVRWERPVPMQLWQLDVTASAFLAGGAEVKIVTGIDDHSRYCVIARAVRRATARPVCRAFIEAMTVYGVLEEVLTDNGTVFTGRFIKPRPAEVLSGSDLPGERHHRAADQAPVTDDHGQDRAAAPVPARRAAGRARPVRVPRGAAGRAGCVAAGVQHRPAAPVAGHGLPRLPVRPGGIAAAAAGTAPADPGQRPGA